MRFSELDLSLNPAHLTDNLAKKSTRSGRGRFLCSRALILPLRPRAALSLAVELISSLKEIGTVMIRPSNSGSATLMAVSIGPSPSSLSSQSDSLPVLNMPWMIGTFSWSR